MPYEYKLVHPNPVEGMSSAEFDALTSNFEQNSSIESLWAIASNSDDPKQRWAAAYRLTDREMLIALDRLGDADQEKYKTGFREFLTKEKNEFVYDTPADNLINFSGELMSDCLQLIMDLAKSSDDERKRHLLTTLVLRQTYSSNAPSPQLLEQFANEVLFHDPSDYTRYRVASDLTRGTITFWDALSNNLFSNAEKVRRDIEKRSTSGTSQNSGSKRKFHARMGMQGVPNPLTYVEVGDGKIIYVKNGSKSFEIGIENTIANYNPKGVSQLMGYGDVHFNAGGRS